MDRPTFLKDEHLIYLDNLREKGTCNMFGSVPFLMAEFGLEKYEAEEILFYWLDSFSVRHANED